MERRGKGGRGGAKRRKREIKEGRLIEGKTIGG